MLPASVEGKSPRSSYEGTARHVKIPKQLSYRHGHTHGLPLTCLAVIFRGQTKRRHDTKREGEIEPSPLPNWVFSGQLNQIMKKYRNANE